MEVLDSVAHSVRVKPENLRLAEVRVLGTCCSAGLGHHSRAWPCPSFPCEVVSSVPL